MTGSSHYSGSNNIILAVMALVLLLMTAALPTPAQKRDGERDMTETRYRILIVKTRDLPFYTSAADGFVEGLKEHGYRNRERVDIKIIALTGRPEVDDRLVQAQMATKPVLIVTFGTDAARAVADRKPAVPTLFNMILDPISLGLVKSLEAPGGNITGTTLQVNPGKQLDTLLQTVPGVRHIGLLYTSEDPTSLAFLNEAHKEAKHLNMEIEAIAVKTGEKVGEGETSAQALKRFQRVPDALWLIPDPVSTGPSAVTATLEYAQEHKIPVLGSSLASVRSGALLGLYANLEDIGASAAEMAISLLTGLETPATLHVRGPRRLELAINLKVSHEQKIPIPNDVLHLADKVITADSEEKGQ